MCSIWFIRLAELSNRGCSHCLPAAVMRRLPAVKRDPLAAPCAYLFRLHHFPCVLALLLPVLYFVLLFPLGPRAQYGRLVPPYPARRPCCILSACKDRQALCPVSLREPICTDFSARPSVLCFVLTQSGMESNGAVILMLSIFLTICHGS